MVDFAILSGQGECFGNPHNAGFIPTTDKMEKLIYTAIDVIYIILCFIIYWDSK